MSQHDSDDWPAALMLDDEAGPAAFITRARVDDMVLGALDQAGLGAVREGRISGVGRSSQVPKPGVGVRSLAAAALLALLSIGSASAAVMYFGRARPRVPSSAPLVERSSVQSRAVRTAVQSAPAEVREPPLVDEPRPTHRPAARAPEDLLVEGNRLRAERRWSKADLAYTRAAQSAPHSQTAYVAHVASAAVRLEHLHDARGALASYRAALKQSPQGALREEIQWGIAEALRALGERAAEQRALQTFVREFPSSPLVAQARARLD